MLVAVNVVVCGGLWRSGCGCLCGWLVVVVCVVLVVGGLWRSECGSLWIFMVVRVVV